MDTLKNTDTSMTNMHHEEHHDSFTRPHMEDSVPLEKTTQESQKDHPPSLPHRGPFLYKHKKMRPNHRSNRRILREIIQSINASKRNITRLNHQIVHQLEIHRRIQVLLDTEMEKLTKSIEKQE